MSITQAEEWRYLALCERECTGPTMAISAGERKTQILQRGSAVAAGAKGDGTGGADALFPVFRQIQGGRFRHGIDGSRARRFVVVLRFAARRRLRTPENGRV